jgi:phosphocarrier protein
MEDYMKTFTYVIKDAVGIHARPAGLLVKEAKKYTSKATVQYNGKSAECTKLMALMSLGVKTGTEVTVEVQGEDEEAASAGLQAFFEENL